MVLHPFEPTDSRLAHPQVCFSRQVRDFSFHRIGYPQRNEVFDIFSATAGRNGEFIYYLLYYRYLLRFPSDKSLEVVDNGH